MEFCWLGASGVVLLHGRDTPFPVLKVVNVFRMMEQLVASDNANLLGTPLHEQSIDLIVTTAMRSPNFRARVCAEYPLTLYGLETPPPRSPRLRARYLDSVHKMLLHRQQCINTDRERANLYNWALAAAEYTTAAVMDTARQGGVPNMSSALNFRCDDHRLDEMLCLVAMIISEFSVWYSSDFMEPLCDFLARACDRSIDPLAARAPGATDRLFYHGFYAFVLQAVYHFTEAVCVFENRAAPHAIYRCNHALEELERRFRLNASFHKEDLLWHLEGRAFALTVTQRTPSP